MSRWTVRPVPSLEGYAVEWSDADRLLLSRGNRLYHTAAAGEPPRPYGRVTAPGWKAAAARIRLVQRLLRFSFYNVLELADGSTFVTFDRTVGVLRRGRFEPLEGMRQPCRVLRGACALAPDGSVYFGEYLRNEARESIRVYRHAPGARALETAYTFPAGTVRHVHGIYRDPHTSRLWCLTGDRGAECRFVTTDDGFRSVETVGSGDETWRSVSAQFTREHVYYGTDAEFRDNHLYRLHRASGKREVLAELDGPVYYSRAVGDDLFFGVTAELCPSQKDRSATLWHVSDSEAPARVISFEKDVWPTHYFQVGVLHPSQGPGDGDGFYLHAVGLAGADNRTYRVERAGTDGAVSPAGGRA